MTREEIAENDWLPIKTAPHDGTIIWLLSEYSILGSDRHYFTVDIVKFDSWQFVFRKLQSGEVIDVRDGKIIFPIAWQPCNIPNRPMPDKIKELKE